MSGCKWEWEWTRKYGLHHINTHLAMILKTDCENLHQMAYFPPFNVKSRIIKNINNDHQIAYQ